MLWLIYILLDALVNWFVIEKQEEKPFYLILFLIRGGAAVLYGAFVLDVQANSRECFNWFIQVTFPFPFVFNTTLNLLRGKSVSYFGAESGWIDSFVVKNKLQVLYFVLTIILFLISTTTW